MNRTSNKLVLYFITALLCSGFIKAAHAQNVAPKDVVKINAKTERFYNKNKNVEVVLNLLIKDGWHINANKPFDDYLSPTVVLLDDSTNIKAVSIKYPVPIIKKLSFSETQLALYENEADIRITLQIKKDFNKPVLKIKGTLQYQPCNNQTCLFPVSKPFSFEVHLKK